MCPFKFRVYRNKEGKGTFMLFQVGKDSITKGKIIFLLNIQGWLPIFLRLLFQKFINLLYSNPFSSTLNFLSVLYIS